MSTCKQISELNMKVNDLAIGSVTHEDFESLECITARNVPQHQIVTSTAEMGIGSSSSNESQTLLSKDEASFSLEKVPFELLGMVRMCSSLYLFQTLSFSAYSISSFCLTIIIPFCS